MPAVTGPDVGSVKHEQGARPVVPTQHLAFRLLQVEHSHFVLSMHTECEPSAEGWSAGSQALRLLPGSWGESTLRSADPQ